MRELDFINANANDPSSEATISAYIGLHKESLPPKAIRAASHLGNKKTARTMDALGTVGSTVGLEIV